MIMHLALDAKRAPKTERLFKMIQKMPKLRKGVKAAFVMPNQSLVAAALPDAFSDVAAAYLALHAGLGDGWTPGGKHPDPDGSHTMLGRVLLAYTRGKPQGEALHRSFLTWVHYERPHCPFTLSKPQVHPAREQGSRLTPAMEVRELFLDALWMSAQRLFDACREPESPFSRAVIATADYHMNPQVWTPEPAKGGKISYRYESALFPDSYMLIGGLSGMVRAGPVTRFYTLQQDEMADPEATGAAMLRWAVAEEMARTD